MVWNQVRACFTGNDWVVQIYETMLTSLKRIVENLRRINQADLLLAAETEKELPQQIEILEITADRDSDGVCEMEFQWVFYHILCMLCTKYGSGQATDCCVQSSDPSLLNKLSSTEQYSNCNQQSVQILDQWTIKGFPRVFKFLIALKEVCKALNKVNHPKQNQEKDNKVCWVKNCANID